MRIFYYNMRHYLPLPLENVSSKLRRLASRSKGTSRRRHSAPSGTRKIVKKASVDVGFQYGQPLPDAIQPATLKTGDNVENLSKRIDHLEKEHSEMMAEHKTILEKTAGIEKTHSRILNQYNFITSQVAQITAKQMIADAIKSKKTGGATRRRKRRVYK